MNNATNPSRFAIWQETHADRIATLRRRAAFSAAFIADKNNPLEKRLAEKKALKSWTKSLADLGVGV